VLVTGAGGFVGGAVAGHLAAIGHDVVGLSRRPGAVPGLYGLLEGNIADTEAAARVARKVDRCEAIVHAAATPVGSLADARLVLTNALGTQQMLELAGRWEPSRFVYFSSLPVIGRPRHLPVTEDHPAAPSTPYHASKLFGEHLVAAAVKDGLSGVSLRLTSTVGPGMPDDRIVSVFVQRALAGDPLDVAGEGTRAQDYLDVRDVGTAVEACLQRSTSGLLNLAAGRAVENRELAHLCVRVLGSKSDVRLGAGPDAEDEVRWEVSIGRATEELAWSPQHDLQSSVRAIAAEQPPDRSS
jgi:nucleoside-diphosphate-sugar epimerase